MNKSKQSKTTRVFCKVTAGINTCNICCNEAYYSLHIPQNVPEKFNNKPIMCLLRCGHGICENCYNDIKSISQYTCPYCRHESVGIINTFGSNSIKGTMNTLGEFVEEWKDYLPRAFNSQHIFAKMHRQITDDYRKKRRLDKSKRRKADKLIERKKQRSESRKKAICKHCGKDTFTSEKQLQIHIKAKHQ